MKLLYLTNIPAPYRIKRFNDMVEIFRNQNIDFEVMFMAENEPGRDWNVNKDDMHFKYKIWPGFHPTIMSMFAHFNPSLLWRLRKHDYDIIIIAGISTPTLMLAPYFVGKKVFKVISVETNLRGDTKKTGFRKRLKGWLLDKADGYQVTGALQKEYIYYFAKESRKKPFVVLPNLINGNKFHERSTMSNEEKQELRMKYGIPLNTLACIIPARLVDIKYPKAFLQALPKIKSIHFILVGSGPLEEKLNEITNDLPATMIPFQQESEMIRLYGIADVFCLASVTDASPLTTIEASCCSLPLLLSNRIGNINDVLIEGENGFSFDPYSEASILSAFEKYVAINEEQKQLMGKVSRSMYLNTFENVKCLTDYAKGLKNMVEKRN